MSIETTGMRVGIQSVSRAMAILRQFQDGESHRVSSLAEATGLGISTVHRLVRTLVDEGMLEQSLVDTSYRLGYGAAAVGRVAISRVATSRPRHVLESLRDELGEGASFGIPSNGRAFVLLRFTGDREDRTAATEILGGPPHACVLGKVFLAFGALGWDDVGQEPYVRFTDHTLTTREALAPDIDETRSRGYALMREERTDGGSAIAVPVFAADGSVTAAISVYGSVERFDPAFIRRAVSAAQAASRAVTSA